MPERELLRLELANQIAASRAFLASDPAVAATYGTALDTVGGLAASTCRAWAAPLFNRVIGAGILGPLDAAALDAIGRHYAAKGGPACVEVYEGHTPPEIVALLERSGFDRSDHGLESHVLETDHVPDGADAPVAVRPCVAADHVAFAGLVRDGFGVTDVLGRFFVDATLAALRALGDDTVAFIASVDGKSAGTGQLVLTERVAGCYSGSVLEPYRGRGIQKALLAARVREGLARGRRIFTSQTDPDSPSGHNLRDLGFRPLYRASWYLRPA